MVGRIEMVGREGPMLLVPVSPGLGQDGQPQAAKAADACACSRRKRVAFGLGFLSAVGFYMLVKG